MKIDPETRAIISHTAPVKPKTFNDMEEAARALKEHDSRRDSIFRQSVEAQRNASDLLEKKFQEAVRKAKETPDTGRPIRDFDLD
jgi:molecular chaperone DnaK (HSP70)